MRNPKQYSDDIDSNGQDAKLFRRLLTFAKPYSFLILISIFLILMATGLELLWPQFVRSAINHYVENNNLSISEKNKGLYYLGIIYLITLIFRVILEYGQILIMNYTGQNIIHDIRMKLFQHVEQLSIRFFTMNPVGRLVTRITNDVNQLNELFSTGIVGIFGDIIMLVGILCFMLWMHLKLAMISFTVLPLIFVAVALFRKYIRPVYLEIRKKLAMMNAFIQEHLTGIKIVQMFNQETKSKDKFDKLNSEFRDTQIKMIKIHGIFMPSIEAISTLSISILLAFGAVFIFNKTLQIGTLVAFLMYSKRFFRPVRDLSQKYTILQDAMTASSRIFALMDNKDMIKDTNLKDAYFPLEIKGNVEYKDIMFAYNEPDWILKNINFQIAAGEKIALVGITGSGKTTLANLLARFYDYQSGSIKIDDKELREIPLKILRKQLAYVHQDFFLFAGTILENITLWNKEISKEKAIQAAKIVNVNTFAEKLPLGYDEPILEGGSNLSTGQKQLISFARALAFSPKILILDEATSNIDSETEKLVQDALRKLMGLQTSIIIAHRLSTIKDVDRILVIQKGKIVEEGNHDSLLKIGGIYSNLYELQFKNANHQV